MYLIVLLGLLALGFAGAWVGLVEGFNLAFLLALGGLAAAVLFAFNGGAGRIGPPTIEQRVAASARGQGRARTKEDAETMRLAGMIVVGLAIGAAGLWLALVEDFKIAFLIGGLMLAGAVLAAFRGKAAF